MAALTQPAHIAATDWTGTVRTFGKFGSAYEVTGSAGRTAEGKELVFIRVLRTGETTEYEIDSMLQDPEAM